MMIMLLTHQLPVLGGKSNKPPESWLLTVEIASINSILALAGWGNLPLFGQSVRVRVSVILLTTVPQCITLLPYTQHKR